MSINRLLVVLATAVTLGPSSLGQAQQHSESGTVILHAIDIDSGGPIAGLTFAIENSLAEDWATAVGESGEDGQLRIESKPRPGYFYSVFPEPKDYKIVGLDAVPSSIVPGKTVEHYFHLRKRNAPVNVPDIIPRPEVIHKNLTDPTPLDDNIHLQVSTADMPGFEGEQVRFIFYPTQDNSVDNRRLQTAEDILRNGKRLRAALDEELTYFRKAEKEKAGDIRNVKDVIISVGHKGWVLMCRTEGCLKLKQDGFKVHFDANFEQWDLAVPDYLHPDF